MVSANWKLGRPLGLFSPRTMVQPGLRRAPRIAALMLSACLALPSARADGWQGTGGNQGGNWSTSGENRGNYRGGGHSGDYRWDNHRRSNENGTNYSEANYYHSNRYHGGNYYHGGYNGGGHRRPYGYGRPYSYGRPYGYRPVYAYRRPYAWNHGWNRGWQNGGYWGYRPWNAGWYNWAPNNWSWWGPSAVGWGVMGLATGAVITGLVNSAAQNQSTVVVVPDTTIRLDFASVLPAGEGVVSFRYIVGSSGPAYQSNGDCRQGLFNGQPPRSVAEAQLLNTTCHVAYGNGNGAPNVLR